MVTLKEIAARCNCSIATVSKALNDMPDISVGTSERIRAIAADMGYLPNATARALKTNHSKTVALIAFIDSASVWRHDYFSAIASSIGHVLSLNGYDIAPIEGEGQMIMGSYVDYCRYRNYDGLVLLSMGAIDSRMQELVDSRIPLVTIDYAFHNRGAVLSDNVQGMRDLVVYAHDMGHEKIAFIHGEDTAVTRNRLASFYTICDELGIAVNEKYIVEGLYRDTDRAAAMTRRLMSLDDPPTCIIYPDDYACIGGMNELANLRLCVPRDVSIAGYDGIDVISHIRPRIATISQDTAGIGERAANMLLSAIEKPRNYIPRHITLPGTLIEGESVRDLRQRGSARVI